jgi:hypothetical protein
MSAVQELVSVSISISGEPEKRLSYERDLIQPGKPELIDASPYSHEYTGKHDHGDLPPPKQHLHYSNLLDAVLTAKKESDEFIKPFCVPPPPPVKSSSKKGSKKARIEDHSAEGIEAVSDEENDGDEVVEDIDHDSK